MNEDFSLEEGVLRSYLGTPDQFHRVPHLWMVWGPIDQSTHKGWWAGVNVFPEKCVFGIDGKMVIPYPSQFADLIKFLNSDEFKKIWSRRPTDEL